MFLLVGLLSFGVWILGFFELSNFLMSSVGLLGFEIMEWLGT